MPPIFTKHLADRLHQLTSLNVVEAKQGDALIPGGVWLAPGDFHMTLNRIGTVIRVDLNQGTPENSCRPAVDVLFRSVNETYGANVLSVVLTGMGQDGARGCEAIRNSGGKVIAQDEATSVVWGMPGAVVQAGLANKIVPLERIADEIVRETIHGRKIRTLEKVGM
jgi:two-component system chemotaxis response regulator CheB